jgi:hypothetical protein
MSTPTTLRKDALFATEPGMMKMEYVKLAADRGTCSLPSLLEYAIYAVGQETWKLVFVRHVEEAAGLSCK